MLLSWLIPLFLLLRFFFSFHPITLFVTHSYNSLKVLTFDLSPTIGSLRYLLQLVMICAPNMFWISNFICWLVFGLKKSVVFCLLMAWPDALSYDSNMSSNCWHSTVVVSQNSRLLSTNSKCEILTPPLQDNTPLNCWFSMALRMRKERPLAHRRNRYEDKGSPCLMPQDGVMNPLASPLIRV